MTITISPTPLSTTVGLLWTRFPTVRTRRLVPVCI